MLCKSAVCEGRVSLYPVVEIPHPTGSFKYRLLSMKPQGFLLQDNFHQAIDELFLQHFVPARELNPSPQTF